MSWRGPIVAAGLAVLLAAPTAGWAQDRPDIPDTQAPSSFARLEATNGVELESMNAIISGQSYAAVNLVYVSRVVFNPALTQAARAAGVLFEADKVTRTFDKQVLVQSNFAGIQLGAGTAPGNTLNATTTTSASASQVSGCKVKGKVTRFDAVNLEYDFGTGVVACSEAALNALIANPAGRARIKSLLGTQPNGTGVKSKAKDMPHL